MLSGDFLQKLLFEEESSMLDFKSAQYPFSGASDADKSELLKDILAFANSWRHSDAYILIGVEETRGGRSKVLGVSEHLDDASLQQFVNSKTNRPVQFSYFQHSLDGVDIGVLLVPLQPRPVFLVSKYGKLEQKTVYIRRGSSTNVAGPDEIAQMGMTAEVSDAISPTLDLQFYDHISDALLGTTVHLHTVNIEVPRECELPEYEPTIGFLYGSIADPSANRDYYRQYAEYLQLANAARRVELAVSNMSAVSAQDVRLEISVTDHEGKYLILDASDIPLNPHRNWGQDLGRIPLHSDVHVERLQGKWSVTVQLGKIQPKAKASTSKGLYIGAREQVTIVLHASVFADNLPAPLLFVLEAVVLPVSETMDLDELLKLADQERRT